MKKIVVMISGSGSNLEAIIKACNTKNINCFASIQHGILTPPQEKNLGKN